MKVIWLLLVAALLIGTTAQADLRAYWAFDEGQGDIAYDASAYGNHGQLIAATEAGNPPSPLSGTTSPAWTTGVNNGALLFGTPNGQNFNYVAALKSDSLRYLGANWSVSTWIRQDEDSVAMNVGDGAGYQRLISCPNYEIELGVPGWKHDYFWPYGTSEFQLDIGTTGPMDTWYHFALTYDGENLTRYINGVGNSIAIADQEINDIWKDGWDTAVFKIGGQTWPDKDFFMGALDDVAIWGDCYLDADGVAALYNNTATPLTVSVVPEPATLTLLALGGSVLLRKKSRN